MNMKEIMDQERAEAIATLEKANGALSRIFNMEEGESIPTIREELEWCEIELANIKAGLFSMYSQDYIEGAISALRLTKEGEGE